MSDADDVLDAAAAALRRGGVVAIPTDTVYGLAARAQDPNACERLFAMKGRPDQVALPVLVAGLEQAAPLVADVALPDLARLAEAFWPGPLTVVVARRAGLGLELGGDPATIGVRCPGDRLATELCRRAGALATTSANRHGEPPCHDAAAVRATFGDALDALVDGGRRDGAPSTVVGVAGGEARLWRDGPVDLDAVVTALRGG